MLFSELPEDIIIHTLDLFGVKEILKLEQLCRALRHLILSTQHVWLVQLRRLDQAHAPNLPFHIDARTLKSDELRSIVIKAVQGYENWRNGTFDEDKIICVELNDPPNIASSGEGPWIDSYNYVNEPTFNLWTPMIKLVPGGRSRYLFLQWTNGFVQMVDTETQKAVWTYPDPSSTDDLTMAVEGFDVDVQNGDSVTVAISRLSKLNTQAHSRDMLAEVFRIKLQSRPEIRRVYSRRTENLTHLTELDATVIKGDFISVLLAQLGDMTSLLMITNFVSDQTVFVKIPENYETPSITIIVDHIFLSCSTYDNPEVPLLRVLDIRHLFATLREEDRASSVAATINVDTLGFTDIHFELPPGYETDGRIALPTLCSFHWQEEHERFHQLTIAVNAWNEDSKHTGPFIFRYAFTPRKSDTEPPVLRLLPCTNVLPPLNEMYLFYRKQITLSGRLLLQSRHLPIRRKQPISDLVLATIDDKNVDDNGAQCQPFRPAPKWLPRLSSLVYDVDYLSGAIICTGRKERWIKIAYPA